MRLLCLGSKLFFLTGMYGKNNIEAAFIDQILDTVLELSNAGFPFFTEKDEEKKVNKLYSRTSMTPHHENMPI